ncbi:hypothetical protein [Azospirillum sp. sgz301742]
MIAYLFAGLVGLTALAFALLQAVKRLRETEQMVAKAEARRTQQVERIKRAARQTLGLARELSAARRRKTSMEFACADLEERLRVVSAVDRRIFVLDDRHTQNDQGWLVRVSNGDYAGRVNANLERSALDSWKRGRRFLVWGLDEHKVREKVSARFPHAKGFTIQSVEPRAE